LLVEDVEFDGLHADPPDIGLVVIAISWLLISLILTAVLPLCSYMALLFFLCVTLASQGFYFSARLGAYFIFGILPGAILCGCMCSVYLLPQVAGFVSFSLSLRTHWRRVPLGMTARWGYDAACDALFM